MVATDAWVKTALDEPDHSQGWDTSNWTPRDYELRGDVPIVWDWEVLCGQCGELMFLKLTEAAAEAYSRTTVRGLRVRFNKAAGGLGLRLKWAKVPKTATEVIVELADA